MELCATAPGEGRLGDATVMRTASVSAFEPEATRGLMRALGPGPFALVMIFAAPRAPLEDIARAARADEQRPHPGEGFQERRGLARQRPQHRVDQPVGVQICNMESGSKGV